MCVQSSINHGAVGTVRMADIQETIEKKHKNRKLRKKRRKSLNLSSQRFVKFWKRAHLVWSPSSDMYV